MKIRLNRYVNIVISLLLLTGCSMHVAAEIRKPEPLALHKEVQEEVREETPVRIYTPPRKTITKGSTRRREPMEPLKPYPQKEAAPVVPEPTATSHDSAPSTPPVEPSAATPPADLPNVEKTGNIVLLCYHALCKEAPTQDPWQFFRLAADFEKDLELIQKSGIKVKSYGDLLNALKNNDPSVKEPAIILQFDDGLMSDFTLAFPLLKKFGIKSTHFISSNRAAEAHAGFMSTEEILSMKAYRSAEDTPLIEFGVHGAAHIPIGRQEEETEEEFQKKLLEELTKSKETLEGMLNEPLTLLALPFGSGFQEEPVQQYAAAAGYELVRGWRENLGHFPSYPLENLVFYPVYNNSDITEALKLTQGRK